jgi:hypothetical protein
MKSMSSYPKPISDCTACWAAAATGIGTPCSAAASNPSWKSL